MPIEGAVGGDCLEFLSASDTICRGYGELCIETGEFAFDFLLESHHHGESEFHDNKRQGHAGYGNGDPCAPACAFRQAQPAGYSVT